MYNLLKIGDSEINDFKIGTEQVDKIYLGTQLLWKKSNIYGWYVNPSISNSYDAVSYIEDTIGIQPASMYRQVEYIKSTGTQCITTDIIPNVTDKLVIDLCLGTFHSYMSAGNSMLVGTPGFGVQFGSNTDANYISFLLGHSWATPVDYQIKNPPNFTSRGTLTACRGTSASSWNSTTVSVTKPVTLIPDSSIKIFGYTDKIYNCYDVSIYSVKLYDNLSNLLYNLIPVERQSDGELGLYDTITDKFYTNSGTGTFVKGNYVTDNYFNYGDWQNSFFMPKPCMLKSDGSVDYYLNVNDYTKKIDGTASDVSNSSYDGNAMMEWPLIWYKFESLEDKGYKQVEYIQSNGNQCIITDIMPKNSYKYEITVQVTNTATISDNPCSWIFGANNNSNGSVLSMIAVDYIIPYASSKQIDFRLGKTVQTLQSINQNDLTAKQHIILSRPNSYFKSTSGNYTITMLGSVELNNPIIPLAIFGGNYKVDDNSYFRPYNLTGTLLIYDFRIYDENDGIIHNLIPTERQSDNELGLYDTITNKFYTNASTGTFVKGNYVTENHGWFYCSDTKVDSSYNCWSNYDCYNHITPHFYTPIYNTTISNNTMRSLSGLALTTANGSGTTTGRLELDSALANNTTPDIEWYSGVWSDRVLISALMVLISKSLNNQAIFGNGINTQANKEAYTTGTLNDKGLFYGSFADNASAVKIFGMENFYGCVGQRIAGLVGTDTGYAYKLTYGNIDGSNADTYNDSGLGYKFIANQPTATSTLNWIDKMHFGDYGALPVSVSGGANTYWADSFWSGINYAVIGRNDSNSDYATGSLSIDLTNSFSTASWNISGSLSCKPVLRLTNVDTANLRIHRENIINYRPNGNSTVEVQLYVKNSSYLPAYNELTGRIILAGSTATSIDDEKIYMLDVDNEWKVMYEIEQN